MYTVDIKVVVQGGETGALITFRCTLQPISLERNIKFPATVVLTGFSFRVIQGHTDSLQPNVSANNSNLIPMIPINQEMPAGTEESIMAAQQHRIQCLWLSTLGEPGEIGQATARHDSRQSSTNWDPIEGPSSSSIRIMDVITDDGNPAPDHIAAAIRLGHSSYILSTVALPTMLEFLGNLVENPLIRVTLPSEHRATGKSPECSGRSAFTENCVTLKVEGNIAIDSSITVMLIPHGALEIPSRPRAHSFATLELGHLSGADRIKATEDVQKLLVDLDERLQFLNKVHGAMKIHGQIFWTLRDAYMGAGYPKLAAKMDEVRQALVSKAEGLNALQSGGYLYLIHASPEGNYDVPVCKSIDCINLSTSTKQEV
ncbi:hypothetical protein FA15DRAFT_694270 [Coprinopsis marcescibilis]|uniref:Uncharacterized protein n=1 Tax=Coprinopsis marcescibilis TaxID=230819 RepID=A0A5C3KVZ3_COPMA|nr:hypothetical protein FA15DRAFT_694270 [Coprinopsis marcescibilis]